MMNVFASELVPASTVSKGLFSSPGLHWEVNCGHHFRPN